MKIKTSIIIFFLYLHLLHAIIPLPNNPSWTSVDTDYSTGGALYDINMDGWIDYCTGNGNDMASNRNGIYMSNNGTLETNASWRSTESGYFSHIYIGDVNNDSFPDMAVSYLGAGANQGPAYIYRNNGSGLVTTAWWTSQDHYNSFDCAFGDFDLDADLDLAVAAGDAYSNIRSPARVYLNNTGVIGPIPFWMSSDSTPSDACRWIDIDNDGFMDLIVGYRRKIAIYKNTNGILSPVAFWSTTVPGWVLRIAIGDYNNDGYKDFAIACNGQLSGDSSRILIFRNNAGIPQTPPAYVLLTNTQYCSCVEWGDPNNDGWLDLAAGGWWEPVVVFENVNGTFNTTPAWSWNGGTNLVCETVMWNDVDKSSVVTITEYKSGDGNRKLFYLNRHPIQGFNRIKVNNIPVALSDYTFEPLTGWVSLKNAPPAGTNNIEISYQYARYADLGVTNWTRNVGNYLFANTIVGIEEQITQAQSPKINLTVYPNPFTEKINIKYAIFDSHYRIQDNLKSEISLSIYDATGRMVRQWNYTTIKQTDNIYWDGTDQRNNKLASGVYIIQAVIGNMQAQQKVVLTR
ncbi:MAG: FG-GAP-like repeat-containing protein [bacterium]